MNTKRDINTAFFSNLKGKTVMLYVSSNSFNEGYLSMPYDYVILNSHTFSGSHDVTESAIKIINDKVIIMPYENNRALRILIDAGVKIMCFVGINDGCSEGGNHECVNSSSFYGRLSPILEDEMYYITDHFDGTKDLYGLTSKLGFLNTPHKAVESFDPDLITFDENVFYDFPEHKSEHLWFIPLRRSTNSGKNSGRWIGRVNVSTSHDSLWSHEKEFDCIIHGKMNETALRNYLPFPHKRCYLPVDRIDKNPRWLLEQAMLNKWKRVGLIPYMQGHYEEFLALCEGWQGRYPEHIHFFYLEDRDMEVVRKYIPENLFG